MLQITNVYPFTACLVVLKVFNVYHKLLLLLYYSWILSKKDEDTRLFIPLKMFWTLLLLRLVHSCFVGNSRIKKQHTFTWTQKNQTRADIVDVIKHIFHLSLQISEIIIFNIDLATCLPIKTIQLSGVMTG